MSLAYLLNTCWMASGYREARAFERDSTNVRATQIALLLQILRQNQDTWFGRQNGFATIQNERDFQHRVPVSSYDDYRAAINRIGAGEPNVLTDERIQLLEPTGGSSSGEKLIPYTLGLRRSFLRAIRTWIWDLYSERPAVRSGRSYWSITPMANVDRRTSAGIPIGFESDTHYLSRGERLVVERTVVAPPEVLQAPSIADAQYATLFHLLRARDLTLISAWSPTFVTALLRSLADNWPQLVDDIAAGQITFNPAAGHSHREYRQCRKRSEELRRIFKTTPDIHQSTSRLWPSLALVSCWTDGPSFVHANQLKQYLGKIELQPKGLLATEALVTIPLLACPAPALAIRSHFFEFLAANADTRTEDRQPLLADELTVGERYRVLVTTDGGLYRYDLHDEVEMVGCHNQVPLLRFVGKTNEVSDLVGEKLHAGHVQSVLQHVFRRFDLNPTFARLSPNSTTVPSYVLQLTAPEVDRNSDLGMQLRTALEDGLESNPGYKYAREIGQLRPLEIELVDEDKANSIRTRETDERLFADQRLGDIKPTTLGRETSSKVNCDHIR